MLLGFRNHLIKIGRLNRVIRILIGMPLMTVFILILSSLGIKYDIQQAVIFSVCAIGLVELLIARQLSQNKG